MEHFGNEFTTVSYLIDAANTGKSMIRVLSKNTCMVFLLVRRVHREEMERWDMTMLATVSTISWHARPRQLRHDIIYIRQRQDKCAINTILTEDFLE